MSQPEWDVEPLLKRVTPLPYRLGILLGDQDGRADFSRQIPQRDHGAKQEKTKEGQRIFTIKYGSYSVYGTGWYILTPEGGGLAWNVKSENSHCPALDELEGYGGILSCPVAQV